MDDFSTPPTMPRPRVEHVIGQHLGSQVPPISLEETPQGWMLSVYDGMEYRRALLPDSVAKALGEQVAKPQPVVGQPVMEYGIRWAEDPETVQGPLDLDYAQRKASASHGDVIVHRVRTDHRPTLTPWEPLTD